MTIWSLSNAQGGWLAGIMSGGYMLVVRRAGDRR